MAVHPTPDEAATSSTNRVVAEQQQQQPQSPSPDEQEKKSPVELATEYKVEGNAAYGQKRFTKAIDAYNQGLQILASQSVSASPQEDNNDDDAAAAQALRVNFLLNRAQCYNCLNDFQAAEASCTAVLEEYQTKSPKAFHRRAMAREGQADALGAALIIAKTDNNNKNQSKEALQEQRQQQHEQQLNLYLLAKKDLQNAMAVLEDKNVMAISEKEKKGQKKAILEAAMRLQRKLTLAENKEAAPKAASKETKTNAAASAQSASSTATTATTTTTVTAAASSTSSLSSKTSNSSSSSSSSTTTPRVVARRPRRSPAVVAPSSTGAATTSTSPSSSPQPVVPPKPRPRGQQRQDVLRLLLSRQTQITADGPSIEGEAFYILDWCWWYDFCKHVDLFYKQQSSEKNGMGKDKNDNKQRSMVLRSLPPGAVVPGEEDGDDDAANGDDYDGPPGPIDNSALFMVPTAGSASAMAGEPSQQTYYRQWHRATPIRLDVNNNNNNSNDDEKEEPQLLPNLVRGYDYEIIPREVYNALREWYGEVTPSICRRSVHLDSGDLAVVLYPQLLQPTPPLIEWNSNLYDRCGACRRSGVRLRCRRCMGVYYCDRDCQQSHWPYHKQYCQQIDPEDTPTFVAQSEGRVGLITLGNTCFMNSALQCLSHTAPLTRHFLSNKYSTDLNRTNPLGTGGKLADSYAAVLRDLWMRPGAKQVKPYALKRAIAVFAPRFAGTLQHDAQEFLAYLLDGLHEDLNRIVNAPYVEMPDFQDGQNMVVAGARAWEAHLRRNDSLVLDTFYGQFKSTCVCPACNRVSVSFDAFNHVSLEIPQNQPIVPVVVVLVRAPGNDGPHLPERFAIPFRKSNPFGEFKKELSKLSGIPTATLHLSEVQRQEILHFFNDDENAMGIRASDLLVAYEADAFDKPCFHALLKHKFFSPEEDRENRFFGLPLLTSFPTSYSCKQVWEHCAELVKDKVNDPKDLENVFRVALHNRNGVRREIFPVEYGSAEETEGPAMTSVLPKDSDEPIMRFLGQGAHEHFLSMWLEWSDVHLSELGDQNEENAKCVDESRFLLVRDHPSYTASIEKLKAEGNKKKGVTLDECFETFIKPERLDERNMWYCSNCKEHVRAMKTMELWRLPDVLVVHLKRFEFRNVLRRDKLETFVDFPVEGLDMSKHCGSSQGSDFVREHIPATYDLFGVVNHYGRMGFGHYTAYCREWNEFGEVNGWSLFDDSTVTRGVAGNSVVSSAAYVLFYRRRPHS